MHCVVLGGLLKWLRDKESAAKQEPQVMWVVFQNWEDPLEKEMATHSSVLAWRIPRTEEPGRLQSMRSQSWTQLSCWARKSFPFTFCLRSVPACLAGLSPQSSPALCDPVDCSPPGSSIQGILQARRMEWVAIPFSRGSSPPRDGTCISYVLYHLYHLGSLLFKEILFKYKNLKVYTSGFVLIGVRSLAELGGWGATSCWGSQ